jgi:flagellar biosynthesis protein FlhF
MKVKTYKTLSLQEGLEDIKRDLGSEALILSTRSVSVRPKYSLFKKPAWEITAALEEKPRLDVPNSPPKLAGGPERSEGGVVPAPKRMAAAAVGTTPSASVKVASQRFVELADTPPNLGGELAKPKHDPRIAELIDEIGELKKSFRSLSKAIPAKSESLPGGLFAELIQQGIDHDLADHLITTASRGKPAPSEMRERVRRLLADQLIIAPAAELHAKTRMVSAFVGPTGVGKTTTIAKIAGHAAIKMKKRVALISTDMFRIGGQEQLIRLGELLGIPTYGCADVATLKDLVAGLDDRDLILIDTPGSSPSDLARLSKLETVTSAADAKVHLVISATTRSEDITKIVSRFQRFSPNSVIFTKIDETDAKGPLAGDLLRNELPVSYLTNGQRVPEDLLIPSADELARYVLPLESAL